MISEFQISPYSTTLLYEKAATNEKNPEMKLSYYLKGIALISPKRPGTYDYQEKEKVEQFDKCASLWKKAGDVFKDMEISKDEMAKHYYFKGDYNNRYVCASTCYLESYKALFSANLHIKIANDIDKWNDLDDKGFKLLKKALWGLKGIETKGFHPTHQLNIKERKVKILHYQLNLLRAGNHDPKRQSKLCIEIFDKELKLVERCTEITDIEKDWYYEIKKARHLKNAALLATKEEKKKELLLKAETISQEIWYKCPSRTNYPEFSPEYKSSPGNTLLGEIQILLGHCVKTRLFQCEIVFVDC